jgi:hypothetical protein
MTKPMVAVAGAMGAVCVLAACATGVPPSAQAAKVERIQCSDPTAQHDDVRLLRTTTVLKAEPIYSHVISGRNNAEDRVSGAKLLVRPPEGVSAERMTRVLQCHSARVLLGQIDRAQFPDDPYVLPDAWVDIDVKPEAGNFAVTLQSDSISRNLQVLSQATAYAGTHRENAIP